MHAEGYRMVARFMEGDIKWGHSVVGQWVGSVQITKNLINLDLIEIIQFYLKIYDL